MTLSDIIVLALVAAAVIAVIVVSLVRKKKGKSTMGGCGGSCEHCASTGFCHGQNNKKEL